MSKLSLSSIDLEETEIDLNADLGEGTGNDAALMPYLSSCNIACGAHAGNPAIIQETARLAIRHNVKIGAHPSYPDKKNFGRITMPMSEYELKESIFKQILLVKNVVEKEGGTLHHVKPHGALYNDAAVKEVVANVIVQAMNEFDSLALYAPYNSVLANIASDYMKVHHEVFADRNYQDDLTLVSRASEEALLTKPDIIVSHVMRMVKEKKVQTISGKVLPIKADTVCVHGDNPEAVEIVKTLYAALIAENIKVR